MTLRTPLATVNDIADRAGRNPELLSDILRKHSPMQFPNFEHVFGRQFGVLPPLNIDRTGYGLKVIRVYARSIAAKMIQIKTLRNWASQQFVHEAMCRLTSPSHANSPVAIGMSAAKPNPTPGLRGNLVSNQNWLKSRIVAWEKPNRSPLHNAPIATSHRSDRGVVPTAALTQSEGNGTIIGHGDLQSLCRAPGRTQSGAGVFATCNSTKNRTATPFYRREGKAP